ncbi:hypothetical protein LJC20_00375 [Eubacteriales bacterium OttesenSCG-928-M02]|nr:hypothetical protein [Eubacteriales bacterium OttesenSCG-928-M02]
MLELEIKATTPKWSMDSDGNMALTILVDREYHNAVKRMVGEYKGQPLRVWVKQWREKRSLNANAYCWALIGKIADALRAVKDDIYLEMLRRYGQSEMVSMAQGINAAGFLKYFDEAGEGTVNGKLFTHYRVYKGSSEYDTREMSILIDGVISEADDLGIETATPEQIARMKELWDNQDEAKQGNGHTAGSEEKGMGTG